MKKVKVELNLEFSPHKYIYTLGGKQLDETDKDIRINVFFGEGHYFFFYSGIFKKRGLKKNTWLYELILNRDKHRRSDDFEMKPLKVLENVTKEEGRYKYEEIYVSAYLMRRLLDFSNKPNSFNNLEIYES